MTTPALDPVQQAAAGVIAAMGALGEDIRSLRTDAKRQRLIGRITACCLALDLLLTGGLAYFGVDAIHADRRSATTAANSRASCVAGNVSRAFTVQLWENDFATLAELPTTPAAVTADAALERSMEINYAQRVCPK